MDVKIFGIGLNKTGTTSLMHALKDLGYSVCDGFGGKLQQCTLENYHEVCFTLIDKYDAFEDLPWPFLFQEIDRRFPGSKFILTVRPEDKWWKSFEHHFGKMTIRHHAWFYNFDNPIGKKEAHLSLYRHHNESVRNYFRGRPDDFLELNFDGSLNDEKLWSLLCTFLNKEIPKMKFPKTNTSFDRRFLNHLRRLKHSIWGKEPIKIFGVKIGRR